jgi:tRNA threonylcarbamoyladenosine biosynthesis protein TsaE
MTHEITTDSADETIAYGRKLAAEMAAELAAAGTAPLIVLLEGELGAGKTTLVKGIAEGFEAALAENVTSPTFTLIHEYRGPVVTLYHIDLYRIETERELETLGLDDLLAPNCILLVEWGEKFPRLRRHRHMEIVLERVKGEPLEGDPVWESKRRIRRTTFCRTTS